MKATADLMQEKALAARIEVQRLKESIVTREQVRRDADAVGKIWIEEINRMRSEAVSQLLHLDEIGVRHRLDTITDSMLERILQRMDGL
jgi:ATP:corrinoid adenosyltransferase